MKRRFFSRNVFIIVAIDMVLLGCALYGSFLLRLDFQVDSRYTVLFWKTLPLVLLVKLAVFYRSDLYRGMWRYTSLIDLFNIIKASLLSSLVIIVSILFINRFEGFPRSVFVIDALLTLLLIAAFRIMIRLYFERVAGESVTAFIRQSLAVLMSRPADRTGKNLIIIGAGDCGEKIYREVRNNPSLGYRVLGFLDDHPSKIGMKIHGVPVISDIAAIEEMGRRSGADEAVICLPSATSEQMRRIVAHCKNSGLKYRTVPGYGELINGQVSIAAAREVAYRDLLGREVVNLDQDKIGAYLRGKCVLITGAGGSIGSELCRQVCRYTPARLILFERAETPLYEIELNLRTGFKDTAIKIDPLLGDVQNANQLDKVFSRCAPEVVFHAAAYKHVPMLESQPWKAVENNIRGTRNLVEAAKKHRVERFVLVSTDKAVRPTNVMGASKRIAEMLLQSQNSASPAGTQFMIVRFGNVVGSAGSVIPLFKKQIRQGGPLTVTHPEVTRYFMTITEACQLILQAGAIGGKKKDGAEIFILKMGTPVKIIDMARDMIRLSGLEPEVDISIEITGLRPGEKLYEELISEGENVTPTTHQKIMVLNGNESHLVTLNGKIDRLMKFADQQDDKNIRETIKEMVPEYNMN
ncbi:MAG: polysaccharide biosynthesis protein [Desulfosudaceae bacterium]